MLNIIAGVRKHTILYTRVSSGTQQRDGDHSAWFRPAFLG